MVASTASERPGREERLPIARYRMLRGGVPDGPKGRRRRKNRPNKIAADRRKAAEIKNIEAAC
jgi:hypothetical protein